jgi:hypothetical protein
MQWPVGHFFTSFCPQAVITFVFGNAHQERLFAYVIHHPEAVQKLHSQRIGHSAQRKSKVVTTLRKLNGSREAQSTAGSHPSKTWVMASSLQPASIVGKMSHMLLLSPAPL